MLLLAWLLWCLWLLGFRWLSICLWGQAEQLAQVVAFIFIQVIIFRARRSWQDGWVQLRLQRKLTAVAFCSLRLDLLLVLGYRDIVVMTLTLLDLSDDFAVPPQLAQPVLLLLKSIVFILHFELYLIFLQLQHSITQRVQLVVELLIFQFPRIVDLLQLCIALILL